MKFSRREFTAGLAVGITAPYVIGSARAQSATIKIGMCVPVTGPAAEQGLWAQNGAKLALAAVNKAGGVLGKQVELVIEDDQTTNPGIVLAFSKLAAQDDIVGFLGSIRSTQVHAMAPDVSKLGKPVMIGGTDPTLTHMGNQWLFRFRPNDSYSGRVIADYGVNTLGKKKWAIVHSTDAFGTAGGKALAGALEKLGTPAVLDQGYANQSQDFTPVVLAVKQSGADVLGTYFTFENDLGIFARQLRQLGVNIPWVGSPCSAPTALPITPKNPARRQKPSARPIAKPTRPRRITRARGPMMPSPSCRRPSTRPVRPIRQKSARRCLPSRKPPAPKANTTSTRTATACTATMS